jgi:imidazolonepropionase
LRKIFDKETLTKPVLLAGVRQLITLRSDTPGPRRRKELRELGIVEDAAVLCSGGKIVSVGKTKDALRDPWIKKNRKKIAEIDCRGKVVVPGFVDSHTHPAFINPRLLDFEKRIAGASYEQIATAGGGIRSSVADVSKAPQSRLTKSISAALDEILGHGTTTVEAKSGYGLSLDSELKSLAAIKDAALSWPGTLVSTFLGAHVIPKEFQNTPEKYVDLICDQMIPLVARRKLAQFVDVFCDRGAFSEENSLRMFEAA